MKLSVPKRAITLLAVLVPLLLLFVFVALRSGPLAPVAVTVQRVETEAVHPALFGVGTVEARYVFRIGPTVAGRLGSIDVDVGDRVVAGQILAVIDPVDLDDRIGAQRAAVRRGEAQLREATARVEFARAQLARYRELFAERLASAEQLDVKQQESDVAGATRHVAEEEVTRLRGDLDALVAQRESLALRAPVDGLVVARKVEPGSTVVAGQSVVEVIDPRNLWMNARFDQINAQGLGNGLPAKVLLRSRGAAAPLNGSVLRVEPVADAVTEELLAKIVFDTLPEPLPPIGELAEVTVELPPLAPAPVVPNAAIRRVDGHLGVWRVIDDELEFVSIVSGRSDLNGQTQVIEGVEPGDIVVVYSERPLDSRSRIHIVDQLAGAGG